MSTSYYIRCYEGNDEWVSKKWLAHMNLGNDIYMSFFGATKKEAEERARAWYEKELKYQKRIDTSVKEEAFVNTGDPSDWGSFKSGMSGPVGGKMTDTRGSHLAGKIWMVKIAADGTKDKKRVDPSEQAVYEANGYFRGGPRS
jgi:hypothetical protein